MELSREWSRVLGTGNIESTLDFWSDDAIVLPPKMPAVEGKQAIRAFVAAGAEMQGYKISWEPVSAHISDNGDMAYMIEKNVEESVGSDGQRIVAHNKVVTIWRKGASGDWKNVVDIWNETPALTE